MKKETSFKNGAVKLINLSISLFVKFLQPPKCAGSSILVKSPHSLPALLLAKLRNNFKKSVLSVSKQLKDISRFKEVYNQIVVDIRQIINE